MAFDPYHKWLGIPPDEQPANHYRLLSIGLFESDRDVIEGAADRQMAHVRTFQAGQYSALSQQILNELSAAKLCLLAPEKKAAYDAILRGRMNSTTASPPAITRIQDVVRQTAANEATSSHEVDRGIESLAVMKGHAKRRHGMNGWPAAGVAALITAVVLAFLAYNTPTRNRAMGDPRQATAPRTKEEATGAPTPKAARSEVASPVEGHPKRFPFFISDPSRARWSIEGNELVQSALDPNISILFGEQEWKEFDFFVEVCRIEGDHACGLRFDCVDDWNSGAYWVGDRSNLHKVESIEQAAVNQLAHFQGSLLANRWYRVELRLRGDHGQCFLDGTEIMSFSHNQQANGRIGLSTWEAAYRFRNIKLTTPNGHILLEGLPNLDAAAPPKIYEADEENVLAARGGTLPTGTDGRPLNFDFETGDLTDWSVEGDAFAGQPAKGDTLQATYKYLHSRHHGQFWIGGSENARDRATGTLQSIPFRVSHPYASFLVGGGLVWDGAAVELFLRDSDKAFLRVGGPFCDSLRPVVVDLRDYLGKEIFIRVADRSGATWGRISFDDFRFHETLPDLSPHYVSSPDLSLGKSVDVLSLLDIERDHRRGLWRWDNQRRLVGEGTRMIQLPLSIPKEYDLALTVEGAPRADEINLILPFGERQVMVVVDGWGETISGLRLIDGKDANANESTYRGAALLDGQPNEITCRVRDSFLKVDCNGTTIIDWHGDPARVAFAYDGIAIIDAVAGYDGLLVGAPWGRSRISQIALTPVTLSAVRRVVAKGALLPLDRRPAKPDEKTAARPDAKDLRSGHYVRIELPRKGTLTLAEVEVYSGGRNVARLGKATQKSTGYGGEAARGIDGNADGVYGAGGQSTTEDDTDDPWWEVDLKATYPIDRIAIYNRTEGEYGARLNGFTLRVLDAVRHTVVERTGIPAPESTVQFELKVAENGMTNLEPISPQTPHLPGSSLTASTDVTGESPKPAESPAEPRPKSRSPADLANDQGPVEGGQLTATEAFTLMQHTAAVTRIAFHPTLSILASSGKDGRVLLWNLQNRALQLELHKFNEEVWASKFSPDGTMLAFANRNWWGSQLLFKTLAGQKANLIDDFKKSGGGAVTSIAYSHDGRLFAAGQDDGTIRLWDVAQLREFPAIGLGERHNIYSMAFGSVSVDRKRKSNSYSLATGGQDGTIRTFTIAFSQAKGGQSLFRQTGKEFPKAASVTGLRFSADGTLLGCTRSDGAIELYDNLEPTTARVLAHAGSADWIAFHPQTPWCVTAHKDAQVARIWDTDKAELLCELKGHTGGVMCAEFSRDGRSVATASEDFSIKVWDLNGPDVPAVPKRSKKDKVTPALVGD